MLKGRLSSERSLVWLSALGILGAVAVVILLAYIVGTLRQEAANKRHAADVAIRMQSLSNQLTTIDLITAARSDLKTPLWPASAQTHDELIGAVDELHQLDPSDAPERIRAALDNFDTTTTEMRRLLMSGSADDGLNWYQQQVAPAYATFISLVSETSMSYSERSAQANISAGLGALGTTMLAAAVMGLLTWLFERTRRVTQLRAAAQRESVLRQSEERFRSLVQNTADIIMLLDVHGSITYASPSIERVLGYPADSLLGKHLAGLLHVDERLKVERFLSEAIRKPGKSTSIELRAQHANGYWLFLDAISNNLLDNPSIGGILLSARDISERWMLEEQLTHQAFHDSLTKLPNRSLFMDRLGHSLLRAAHTNGRTAVLFLDLNDFKLINDTLGHRIGDNLLTAVGERLSATVRSADTVARLGGDEFTVLLEDLQSADDATAMAERITEVLKAPFTLEDHKVFVGASIGIALNDCPEYLPDDLLRNADIAMYDAKHIRKSRFALFEPNMNQRAWRRLELETELRDALEGGQFRVYYQPIVDLRSGEITEVEALVRWQHPTRGLVAPGDFIPVAEETGLIMPLGNWVLREATRQLCEWQSRPGGKPDLMLSVNLSPRQFHDPAMLGQIAAVIEESKFDPTMLKLEITEGVALDDAGRTLETLRQLKKLGLRLAVDDFGTGYSALSYLKHYPIDTLKIDRSFVKGLGIDPGDTGIVHAVIAFARTLNLQVTAEGIETLDQLRQLYALGCDLGQGYYLSKPLPPEEIFALLHSRPGYEVLAATAPVAHLAGA